MRHLDFDGNTSPEGIVQAHEKYKGYLLSVKESFPKSAFEFAVADWHYDHNDSRCPHDARLDSLEITERYISDSSLREKAPIEITIVLLGAYHDGRIRLSYSDVRYYELTKFPVSGTLATVLSEPTNYHGDWLIDELYLFEDSYVVHEIEFAFGATWKIYCGNLKYDWFPL